MIWRYTLMGLVHEITGFGGEKVIAVDYVTWVEGEVDVLVVNAFEILVCGSPSADYRHVINPQP